MLMNIPPPDPKVKKRLTKEVWIGRGFFVLNLPVFVAVLWTSSQDPIFGPWIDALGFVVWGFLLGILLKKVQILVSLRDQACFFVETEIESPSWVPGNLQFFVFPPKDNLGEWTLEDHTPVFFLDLAALLFPLRQKGGSLGEVLFRFFHAKGVVDASLDDEKVQLAIEMTNKTIETANKTLGKRLAERAEEEE